MNVPSVPTCRTRHYVDSALDNSVSLSLVNLRANRTRDANSATFAHGTPWPCKLMSRAPPASLADASRSGLQGVIQGKRKHTAPSVQPNFPAAPSVQANHAGWQPSAEDTEAFVSALGDGSASHQGSSSVAVSTSGAAWLRRVEEAEVQGEGAEGGGDDDDDEDIWDQNGDEDEDEDMWEDAGAATDDSLLPAGAGAVDVEIQVDEEPEVI